VATESVLAMADPPAAVISSTTAWAADDDASLPSTEVVAGPGDDGDAIIEREGRLG
jgi:hypothetical protein